MASMIGTCFLRTFKKKKKKNPSLFTKCDVSSLYYDVCELENSHCNSFPLSLNKSPFHFMVIHSNVLGPSKVPTLSGSR